MGFAGISRRARRCAARGGSDEKLQKGPLGRPLLWQYAQRFADFRKLDVAAAW
jgi:hypothetical protein